MQLPEGNPNNGVYDEAPLERSPFFKILVYERVRKYIILVGENSQNAKTSWKTSRLCDLFIFKRQYIYSSEKG